ncbi:MAG: hypothetical protein ABR538_10250 [Candidatus Binatia bacterium]
MDWMKLDMWSSTIIVAVFSFVVIGLDEYVIKAWRLKHWEKLAASGDQEKIELLRLAKSAHPVDE